ncbi:MAG: MBOAT family protein, partial [Bacteroidetes bacterium]|nr:MBOAT family protein [Bacteroidota bacterium]
YSVYIYMDFSGYSDIAIGTAYLMGIKTPENFNNPYISQSLREFWKRWHITFSYFLRIYVFKPFIRLYNFIFRSKFYLTVSILAYLSTFLICGLWHGSTVNFVYWGLWHGVGLAINRLWISWVGKKKKLQDSLVYKGVSILITFVFVTVGWMFFQYSLPQLQEIFQLLF